MSMIWPSWPTEPPQEPEGYDGEVEFDDDPKVMSVGEFDEPDFDEEEAIHERERNYERYLDRS